MNIQITEFKESAQEYLNSQWEHYIKDRKIISGLPVSLISTIAAAYLWGSPSLLSGAIFGTVNYFSITVLAESSRGYSNRNIKIFSSLGISYVISNLFLAKICNVSLSHQTALVLAVAAFAGQLYRDRKIASQDPF